VSGDARWRAQPPTQTGLEEWHEKAFADDRVAVGGRGDASVGPALDACTILGVGRKATVDGSASSPITTTRAWPTTAPHRAGGRLARGRERKIVANAHHRDGGNVLGDLPQVRHTYRYFMSRYSFMNEKGVAIAESTFGIDTSTDLGKKVKDVMYTKGDGLIDCWMAQDVALERAATARDAVQIMGKLVEEFGFLTRPAAAARR